MESQRILVIGGTGAQGTAVVKSLLEARQPFQIRVLTRDPAAASALADFPTGNRVELVKGSFMDMKSVDTALQGCYGVYVNTDGFTVKEADEIWAAMRIYEIAKTCPTLRHFVWSGLDYYLKLGNYDPKYACYHVNAKARVNDWLGAQQSSHETHGVAWTILNTGPYMDMLYGGSFIPVIEPDGTRVYSLPLGKGKLPLIALSDLGVFARIIFENRSEWSGQTLSVVSQFVTGDEIAETLTKVTGIPSRYEPCSGEEWVDRIPWASQPVAKMDPSGPTMGENLLMWWRAYEDDLLLPERDMVRLKALNPSLRTLEAWMEENNYDGQIRPLLRGHQDWKQ